MSDADPETTLVQEWVHWGIFVLPIFAATCWMFVLSASTFAMFMLVRSFKHMAQVADSQVSLPFSNSLLLIPLLVGGLVGLLPLVLTWIAYSKSHITLTDRRLVFHTGLLTKTSGELPLENIEAIILAESLLGRLFGYNTVIVTSIGGLHFPLYYMSSARNFHGTLQKAVSAAKSAARPVAKVAAMASADARYMPKE